MVGGYGVADADQNAGIFNAFTRLWFEIKTFEVRRRLDVGAARIPLEELACGGF